MHLNQILLWILYIFRFPIQFLSLERLYLLRLANKQCQKGNENEWASDSGMLNTVKRKHFLHRCWNIYLQKTRKKINVFFSRLFVLNRFGIIEQIAQNLSTWRCVDFGYKSAEPLYFHPFTTYAFYLYDFLFTKLQIFFCFVYHLRDRYLSLLWWLRRVLFFFHHRPFSSRTFVY